MSAVAAIQARTSSTRLPGKVLEDLAGEPLIIRVVERARAAARVDEVVVLTSDEPSDDPLAALCEQRGVAVRRGSLPDVLSRYLALVDELDPTYVVRVTGDCPLIEPAVIDLQLEALAAHDGDFLVAEGVDATLAGQGAMSARAVRTAAGCDDPRDREHVASFFFKAQRARFRWIGLDVDALYRRSDVRLTVDEPADLEVVRAVFEALVPEHGATFPLALALDWLDAHPQVRDANRTVEESADNRAARAAHAAEPFALVGRHP